MRFLYIMLLVITICKSQEEISYIDSSKVRNPSLAWKLSLVPGLGQLYNGRYLKAIGFISVESYAIKRFLHLKADDRIGLRNTYAWWVVGVFIWNIIDSYVDAHLSTFPNKRLETTAINDSLMIKQY